MNRFILALGIVCLLLGPAFAEEAAGERDVWFRMEVGVEPGHVVTVRLVDDPESEPGHDRALLDLDGDGTPETVQEFGKIANARPGQRTVDRKVTIDREGAKWVLDLRYSSFRWSGDRALAYVRWTVTKGGFYAWFINGRSKFCPSAEAAAKEKPIRLGPPFRFDTGVATRGREALVRIGLKDSNGGTLRLARLDKDQTQPRLRLLTEGKEVFAAWAKYG